ncbi:acid phosphatase [[Candida] anglica]|uniref:Acid phosphatase n=1 Tax=[Candida] anglica TaxID=148631 RepID=A0ABP0EE61_9ASCO
MLFFLQFLSISTVVLAAKTILLTNDDGWASTNIRATYRDLKSAGYDVILVAPVSQRSGWGGKFDVPQTKELLNDGEFGYVKKGAPSWGQDQDDKNIWYFNGTPSSCVSFALDYLFPEYYSDKTIDYVFAGPNEGPNLTPGFFTVSGTMGATYSAIYRGIPAVSFSGSDFNNSFFKDSLNNDESNPANIYAKKVVEIAQKLSNASTPLPPRTGLSINFPKVGTLKSSCTNPVWQYTRVDGSCIFQQNMAYNKDSGLMKLGVECYDVQSGYKVDDYGLAGEYSVYLADNCTTTLSVFSTEYDASQDEIQTIHNILNLA